MERILSTMLNQFPPELHTIIQAYCGFIGCVSEIFTYIPSPIRHLVALPNNQLAVGGDDLTIWNVDPKRIISQYNLSPTAMALVNSWLLIAVKHELYTWSNKGLMCIGTFPSPVTAIAYNEITLVGCEDGSVYTSSCLSKWDQLGPSLGQPVVNMRALDQTKLIIAVGMLVLNWNMVTRQLKMSQLACHRITAVGQLTTGELIIGYCNGVIGIEQVVNSFEFKHIRRHTDAITGFGNISADEVVSISRDGALNVFNISKQTGECIGNFGIAFNTLAVLSTGELITGSSDGCIRIWN